MNGGAEEARVDDRHYSTRSTVRPPADEFLAKVDHTIARAQDYFRREQHAIGYWHRPLEANATMDAEYIFFMHFMGRVDEARQQRIVDHLRTQLADGPGVIGAAGHLSNTIEAYFAMKLAGLPASHPAP
jgi:squalene-hopene/tetraprenyl-beta-curcumene cyclase